MEKSPPSTTTGGKAPAKAVAVNMVAKTVEPEMEDYAWLGFLEMSERSKKWKRLCREIGGWTMDRMIFSEPHLGWMLNIRWGWKF